MNVTDEDISDLLEKVKTLNELHALAWEAVQKNNEAFAELASLTSNLMVRRAFLAWADEAVKGSSPDLRLKAQAVRSLLIRTKH